MQVRLISKFVESRYFLLTVVKYEKKNETNVTRSWQSDQDGLDIEWKIK
jgi:hypothetical protein